MKVQLVNPPWQRPGMYGVRAGSRWPHFEDEHHDYMPFPFLLAYAAAVLERDDFEVDCIDALAERLDREAFFARIEGFDPEVLIFEVSTISIDDDLEVVRDLRSRGFSGRVVVCGLHQPMYSGTFVEDHPEVDAVLIGEYELAARDVCRTWRAGREIDPPIAGAICRLAHGGIGDGGRRELAAVDELPWPARHRFDMSLYHDEPGSIPRPSVQMWASRGCPFGCIFCAWPQILYGERGHRPRRPRDVADEFEAMVRAWGFKSVYFDDDTFNVRRDAVLELCRELKTRRLEVPWAAMCRPDLMDEEMLESMRETGLAAVKYGVECGSRELLKTSGKGLNLEKAVGNILLTQEMGIKTHLTFMFGLPGETRQTAEQTIELALRLAPESLQFTIATPFPGSEYHHLLEERGLLVHHSAEHYDGFRTAAVHTGHLGPEELEDILKEANRRWRGIWVRQRKARREYPVDVSVVVPNFHQREALVRCLRALDGQSHDRFEVIVVDNGSRDDSVPAARQAMPDVTVIERDEALGFAASVNLGIEAAKGRYIAVLNNDAEPAVDWLEALLAVFESTPDVGFLASAVVRRDEPGIVDSVGEGLSSGCFPFQVGNGVAVEDGDDAPHEVLGAPATAAIYRSELLDDVGGFDEAFETYLEDLDLSVRAQLAGWRCLAVPAARVRHQGQLSTGGMRNGEVVRLIGRNWVQLVLKSIPKSLLSHNALRIAGVGFRQLAFHTVRSRHPLCFLRGVSQGLWRWRRLVAQRQTILGWRRVDDARIAALMALGDEQLRRTRAQRVHRDESA